MIDRYLLRYFLAVVDEGNFSRAAAQVGVSQPTLSVGIAKLESALGARLFHRSNQQVTLTDGGSRFLPHARRIENDFNVAVASVTERPAGRQIRLGVVATVPTGWLARIAKMFQRQGSGNHLEFVEGSVAGLAGRLERGRIDMALTLRRPGIGRFTHHSVAVEGYAMMLPRRHRCANETMIDGGALAGETMIVRRHCEALRETSRYFIARSVRPPFALRTTSDDRALEMVASGIGVTLMPASFRWAGVVAVPLAGFDLHRDIGLQFAAHADETDRAATVELVRSAIDVMPPLRDMSA